MRTERLVRRMIGGRTSPVAGSIDRAHAGLVTGWLGCPTCPESPQIEVRVDGTTIQGQQLTTPRPDVPGGSGFLLRFTPISTAHDPVIVRVQCAAHPATSIEAKVGSEDWRVPALGRIERVSWPHVSGWIAEFVPMSTQAKMCLQVDNGQTIPVRGNVPRPDVQTFLGAEGVTGFQLNLGDALGYAVPSGTTIRLLRGNLLLDEATVETSPLGPLSESCIPSPDGSDHIEPSVLADLLVRFRSTPAAAAPDADWQRLLDGLGFKVHSASTHQWAEFLAAHDYGAADIAAILAIRKIKGMGVPVLDPLPSALSNRVRSASPELPERVQSWTDDVLGLHQQPESDAHEKKSPQAHDLRVCVAGLTEHRSGLGQNATHSITALRAAGIHACTAPFFPAPGGWNPRLLPTKQATGALKDHSILLHLPIDRVAPALCAQSALLASPRIIGYFMWETEVIPRQLWRPLGLVDEIWTATEFVAKSFHAVTDTPVRVTGHAVDVSMVELVTRAELGIPDDAFVVHFSFDANSTVARKNPNAAIDAFRAAFEGDPSAVFVLKVRNMQQAEHLARSGDPHARGMMQRLQENPSIRLITGELTRARSLGLIAMADCFISLHRSEGYGYAMAEAMALGTPVVATDYSGSRDFMSSEVGWPVGHSLVDVLPDEYFYWEPGMCWAEADVAQAAAALRNIRSAEGVAERVEAAQKHIALVGTIDSLRDAYADALAPTKPPSANGAIAGPRQEGQGLLRETFP
ncbi:MAG TPA: hypothetical protein DCQ36_03440 [Actinobacteria bacterium]|nr:hypothetical protein [Actinomycetota bacterium]